MMQKPAVDPRQLMSLLYRPSLAEKIINSKQPAVSCLSNFSRRIVKVMRMVGEAIGANSQHTHGFLERFGK